MGKAERDENKKENTKARVARKRPVMPPPESEIWPEEYRGKRWKPAFAILFAGRCQLCAYSCPLPKSRQLRDKLLGVTRLLQCTNHPSSPGELLEVLPTDTCRNFRAKRWKPAGQGKGIANPTEGPESNPQVRRIMLSQGLFATVDATDYEELKKYRWHASRSGSKVYAVCHKDGKVVRMHRMIMNPPKGYIVDHIDRNPLNNRRCNLRVCTQDQNLVNRGPKGGSSRFVGVSRCGKKWRAGIFRYGVYHYLGLFDDEVEAAKARDRKAVELHGQYAYLNFPDDWTLGEDGVVRPAEQTQEAGEPTMVR
jgi:hypothetical protein